MAQYVIEIRFAGYAREYLRGLLYSAARRFGIVGVTANNVVPALTLYGPFTTRDWRSVVEALVDVAGKHRLVSYRIRGFSHYRGERRWLVFNQEMNVIYLDVEPSRELAELRQELAQRLDKVCAPSGEVSFGEYRFHAVLPFRNISDRFERLWAYLKEKEDPNLMQRLLRILVLKNGKVMCEYDLVQRRLVVRERSISEKYAHRIEDFLAQRGYGIKLMTPKKRRKVRSRQATLFGDEGKHQTQIMPPIFPKAKGRRYAQATLASAAGRPWIPAIVSPIMKGMRGEEWIPRIIKPILRRTGGRTRQTTLMEKELGSWIPAIIKPIIMKRGKLA